jgi:uncharacterized protein (TIGR04255 family)
MARVRFKRPPVIEVVCGVQFATPAITLKTAHVGLLWQQFASDFPVVEDVPPFMQPLEQLGPVGADVTFAPIQFSNIPPLRRSWFVNVAGDLLIQLQDDRLLFNWKRASNDVPYPSYDVVIEKFEEVWKIFRRFVEDAKVGTVELRQFELTYVNHIDPEHGFKDVPIGGLFVDHRMVSGARFLPAPDGIDWKTSYPLPDENGRLYVGIKTASRTSDRARVIRMDLTARGAPKSATEESRRAWFDLAHDWITNGFADLTTAEMHKIWERES